MIVYTIGYGGRSRSSFLELLRKHKVKVLVDVRRYPNSKFEDFKKVIMEKWLGEAAIKYLWLGDELGGYRKGGFDKYMESAEFQRGVELLLKEIAENTVCIMCLEVSPTGCHRRYISKYLSELSVEVRHIISSSKVVREE
ncbi:MAG: DUF488 domain-containing protein [Nitrososphaerales archaeon]